MWYISGGKERKNKNKGIETNGYIIDKIYHRHRAHISIEVPPRFARFIWASNVSSVSS